MTNNARGDAPRMEDYGGSDAGSSGVSDLNRADYEGKHSGGTEGTTKSGEGEQFGEFGNTGAGTDLTIEMENTDARTGLVKGGEAGAADAGGTARYGGSDGGVNGDSSAQAKDYKNEGAS